MLGIQTFLSFAVVFVFLSILLASFFYPRLLNLTKSLYELQLFKSSLIFF